MLNAKSFLISFSQNSSFVSEALFPMHATRTEELDPSFKLNDHIAKVKEIE